ncbi:hypothetical protein FZC76_13220 [Sutcliffiella horikoshii]|uniref:Uncharacterized protein n=1 Tax=Sutcliffiella horikoshii TaxID=79883 RepID=A0A5D4SVT0_9BACI|nr:hypothetical protein [Sutcliffiella horikoshii]TYS67537.1 hypothetical protein FZC76_13220 [Sutcliffiella horikoshii]
MKLINRIMDLTAYEWIKENTVSVNFENWNGGRVCNLIPNGYTHYCKIMNSTFYRDQSIKDEKLFWSQFHLLDHEIEIDLGEGITLKELATKYNISYDKKISSKAIERKLGGCPRYLIYPDEGRINLDVLKEMTKVMAPFTKNETCYFFYHILKLIGRIPEVEVENGHLYAGQLSDIFTIYNKGEMDGLASPTYWWPEDRSWCMSTDYDLDFTIFGGSKQIYDALMSNDKLECIEVDLETRVDNF